MFDTLLTPLIVLQVSIRVSNLKPDQRVTLLASVQDDGPMFSSYAWFTADPLGHVDVTTSPSGGGTYLGADQMGLFWSMIPEGG